MDVKSLPLFQQFARGSPPRGDDVCPIPAVAAKVEDLPFERGIDICHETVRFRWARFGPMFASEIPMRRVQSHSYSRWRRHPDEVFVRVNGETHYLWRALDHEGEVLEVFATKRRDRRAALHSHFNLDRHLNRRDDFKQNRSAALAEWRGLAA